MNSLKPYILAIDSSTSIMRIGLTLSDCEMVRCESDDRFRHAEFIFELVDSLLSEHGLDKKRLRLIVVSTGPGSFTGLRVGMAAAKGLAMSLEIPIVGVSSFRAAAGRIYREFGKTGMLIRSRRDEYYAGIIDGPEFNEKYIQVLRTDKLASHLAEVKVLGIDFDTGTLNFTDDKVIDPNRFSIEIEDFILAGMKQMELSGPADMTVLEPLYIQTFPAGGKNAGRSIK